MAETETEPKKLQPAADLEDIGPCKVRVKIEVSADKVHERLEGKYKELNESVALPGFRKGHAPRNLLERKFGKAILEDLRNELVRDSYEEVREDRKLEPVGEPDLDVEKLTVEPGKPFAFELTVEVKPHLDLKPYTGLKVARPKFEVKEEQVEAVLNNLRESKAELIPTQDPAQEGDQVVADILVLDGDQELDKAENNALILRPGISFFGIALEDYHATFIGKRPGEVSEYPLETPADFSHKSMAGKKLLLRSTLKSVKRRTLPALDEEFAKSFDMDSVEELREHLAKRVRREAEEELREHMKDHLLKQILEMNDFALPEGLVESGTEEVLQRIQLRLTMQGGKPEDVQKAIEENQSRSKEEMAAYLKTHFILDHIGNKERVFVTEDEVEERVGRLAAQHGQWPHEMKAYLESQGLLTQLRRQMREDKIRDFLLEKAVVEEEKEASPDSKES